MERRTGGDGNCAAGDGAGSPAYSTRALLLTLFGLLVRPGGRPVPTKVIVEAMRSLAVDEANTRKTLNRLAATSLICSERDGRQTLWDLTAAGRRLAEQRDARIFGSEAHPWQGQWLLLAVAVPEERREVRYALRTRLAWAGFGALRPGLWVAPDAAAETDALEILHQLELVEGAYTFVARTGAHTAGQRVMADAWDLDELALRFAAFTDAFAGARPADARQCFAAELRLVTHWTSFEGVDAALPPVLLPADWPGHQASLVFHRCHDAWFPGARSFFESVAGAG